MIRLGIGMLFSSGRVSYLDAHIRREIVASRRAFEKAGFQYAGTRTVRSCEVEHFVIRDVEQDRTLRISA